MSLDIPTIPLAASDLFNAEGGWILLTAAATNAACALVGSFLVLRRMSLMGDALAHAVLPGLAAAFILSGSYSIGPLIIGAVVAGLAAAVLTQTLHEYAGVPADTSMGVAFTSLFALGVVLIKRGISGVHFDVKCVYEGAIELSPLWTWDVFGYDVPRSLVITTGALVVNAIVIALLWKEFKLSSFDPALATTMGFPAVGMHYLLMLLVAVTAVASFEAVGSILVVAMLIVPPATAHLLADRLGPMVLLAMAIGVLAAVIGYVVGVWLDTNLAGMMTVAAGGLYALAVLLSPRYGIISTLIRNMQLSLRVVREDILAMLYRVEELGATRRLAAADAQAALGGGMLARWGLAGLVRDGRVSRTGDRLQLTPAGRDAARQLVRSHRLWETYLVKFLGLPLDHVHEPAHRIEHYITAELQEKLETKVDSPNLDPHGRTIPG
jgi:manganese/zinc/iron transport system permease protein